MKNIRNNSGFTLLEIIIVVIIIGVLASLALPRLFSTVEFSRSTEAMAAIGAVRSSIERCLIKSGSGNYADCQNFSDEANKDLDIENPENNAGSHFGYDITPNGTTGYTITATRNTLASGDGSATITIVVDEVANTVVKSGTNAFDGI